MRTAFVLTVLSLSLVIGVPSAQARFSTEALLYQGGHTIITEYRPRGWDINECDYTGGIVYTSPRRHRVIFVSTTAGLTVGIGHVCQTDDMRSGPTSPSVTRPTTPSVSEPWCDEPDALGHPAPGPQDRMGQRPRRA